MVRELARQAEGRRIVRVERPRCRCRPILFRPGPAEFARRTRGATIERVCRRGKRVILELSTAERIVIEPRMTGLVLVADPPDREHLRLHISLDSGGRRGAHGAREIWFWDRRGLGTVRLVSAERSATEGSWGRLGPDALEISEQELAERLRGTRRAIKVALLDQRLVAGIGNLYAAEILNRARIHPARGANRVTKAEVARLWSATRTVLEEAIKHEGSTLGDGTYRTALGGEGRYQNYHRVYGREGEVCRTCGVGRVIRTVQAQRSTFFCPQCQRRSCARGRSSKTLTATRSA